MSTGAQGVRAGQPRMASATLALGLLDAHRTDGAIGRIK